MRLTHMPMNADMPEDIVAEAARQKIVLVPTIVMMEQSANKVKKMMPQAPVSREQSMANLRRFLKAGVQVIASSDSMEKDPDPPAEIEYGIWKPRNAHKKRLQEMNVSKLGY